MKKTHNLEAYNNTTFMNRFLYIFIFTLLVGFCDALSAQELVSAELKAERSLTFMRNSYGFFMENGVRLYAITYTTKSITNQPDTASGLLVVPVRSVSYEYPMLCYQHGTVSDRSDVPSRLMGGYQLAEALGGMGFFTLAPDFLGLGTSKGVHPYVHAESEAWAAVDMMHAVRQFAENNNIYLNDQVFVTGYSQGGHAAMALHRSLELDHSGEFQVTASAPMSGPYSISTVMFNLILGDEPYSFAAYVPHTLIGYNEVYGIFDDIIETAFVEPYASAIRSFAAEEINLFQLNNQLLQLLQQNTGNTVVRNMLKPSFIALVEEPDNVFLSVLRDNDVYDWSPAAPTRLFYCMADDQVPFENSLLADSVMNLNGATDVLSLDLNSSFDHGQCVTPAVTNTILFFLQYRQVTVSTNNTDLSGKIRIYPNPVADFIRIEGAADLGQLRIINLQGQVVHQQILNDTQIDLSRIQTGTYYLQVQSTNGRIETSTFIKM
jgi:hypothetical protein